MDKQAFAKMLLCLQSNTTHNIGSFTSLEDVKYWIQSNVNWKIEKASNYNDNVKDTYHGWGELHSFIYFLRNVNVINLTIYKMHTTIILQVKFHQKYCISRSNQENVDKHINIFKP